MIKFILLKVLSIFDFRSEYEKEQELIVIKGIQDLSDTHVISSGERGGISIIKK